MRFTSTLLLSATMAAFANAQAYFTMNTLPGTIAPGTNYDISWLNGPGTSTVTIFLVQGSSQSLTTVMSIASGQPHNGTLTFTPSASLATASNYAFKIVDDSNPNNFNYSGMFAIMTSISSVSTNSMSIASTSGSMTAAATASTTGSRSSSGAASAASSGASSASSGASSASSRASSATSSAASAASSAASRASTTGTAVPTAATTGGAATIKAGGLLAVVAAVMMAL